MTTLTNGQISIYSAGKTWHAPLFKEMRDQLGYNIVASWIDFNCAIHHLPDEHKHSLWHHIINDVRNSDLIIVYCGDEKEEQGGAMLEVGKYLVLGKPVYCIGTCASFEPVNHSDRAFTHCKHWHFTKATTIRAGYREALAHYKRHYAKLMLKHGWTMLPVEKPSLSIDEIMAIGAKLPPVTDPR